MKIRLVIASLTYTAMVSLFLMPCCLKAHSQELDELRGQRLIGAYASLDKVGREYVGGGITEKDVFKVTGHVAKTSAELTALVKWNRKKPIPILDKVIQSELERRIVDPDDSFVREKLTSEQLRRLKHLKFQRGFADDMVNSKEARDKFGVTEEQLKKIRKLGNGAIGTDIPDHFPVRVLKFVKGKENSKDFADLVVVHVFDLLDKDQQESILEAAGEPIPNEWVQYVKSRPKAPDAK